MWIRMQADKLGITVGEIDVTFPTITLGASVLPAPLKLEMARMATAFSTPPDSV